MNHTQLIYSALIVSMFNTHAYCFDTGAFKKTVHAVLQKSGKAAMITAPVIVGALCFRKHWYEKMMVSPEWLARGRTPYTPHERCIKTIRTRQRNEGTGKATSTNC
jgi:hypothetical protein